MIDKLEMFIALAREKHFGRAAEALNIAQPSLSAGLKQLEGQLGVQLVIRGARFGGLTPEGQRVLDWALKIVGDTRAMRDEMRAAKQGLTGSVRLAAVPTALTTVAEITGSFARANPDVHFTILSRPATEISLMLDSLTADCGLTYLDAEPMGRIEAAPLYRESFALVAHENTALPKTISWAAAAAMPLCLLTPDMQNRRIINRNFAADGVDPAPAIESNSTLALLAHVEMGHWVTVLPVRLAQSLCAGKPVNYHPLPSQSDDATIGLIAPKRDPQTPVIAAFLAHARKLTL